MNYIDKPIEPVKHYFLFQDESSSVTGMFDDNRGGIYTRRDSYIEHCPNGYTKTHIYDAVNPPDNKCYPDHGSD